MNDSTPKCPWCNSEKHVHAGSQHRTHYCRRCGREFEGDDNDGVVGYGRPERIVARQEMWDRRQREQARRKSYG